jgi:cutinase
VARIQRELPGIKVLGYPVQVRWSLPISIRSTNKLKYSASIAGANVGVADVVKRVKSQLKACPKTKFVLSGYSQGGMVTIQALPKLPKEARDKVVAVVLYGAGDGSGVNAAFKQKTLANCAPGDFACPRAGKGRGHVSYNDKGTIWHDRSAKYVAAAYNGKAQGLKLMRSPT